MVDRALFAIAIAVIASIIPTDSESQARGQTLTVTSPNGGESIAAGNAFTVTWTTDVSTDGIAEVFLYREGLYLMGIGSASLASGEFEWEVCDEAGSGSEFTVHVSAHSQGQTLEDESDAPFTITGGTSPPLLTVVTPNGGETLPAGSTQTVSWTASGTNGYVDAWLHSDCGPDTFLGSAPIDAGRIDWRVPEHIETGDAFTVGLHWLPSCGPQVEDVSDAPFGIEDSTPIPAITVTSPNGGEVWPVDTLQAVTWTSTNATGIVDVWLIDEDAFYEYLGSAPMEDGSLDWPILPCRSNREEYSVLVRWSNGALSAEDTSDAHFATTNAFEPSLAVTHPAGGEQFVPGSSETITWTSSATNGFVEVELCRSSQSVRRIGYAPVSAGSMAWNVCGDSYTANNYTVRLRIAECGVSAESAPFGIDEMGTPSIELLTPQAGDSWLVGSVHTVTWQGANVFGNVDVYLPDQTATHYGWVSVPFEAGSYTWVVPATLPPGEHYRVKIRAEACVQTLLESHQVSIIAANPIEGDADADGDLDLADIAIFQACFTNGSVLLMPPCDQFDMEPDADIDLRDYWSLMGSFTGPNGVPPSSGTFGMADLIVFEQCLAGPSATPSPPWPVYFDDCRERFDHDADGDLDLADFVDFQRRFDGGTAR